MANRNAQTKVMTLASARTRFLQFCQSVRGLSRHTLRAYQCDLDDFLRHRKSTTSVGEIDRDDIQSFVHFLSEVKSLKGSSIKRKVATLRVLFAWLENEEIIKISPFYRLRLAIKVSKRLPRTLRNTELRKLLAATKQQTNKLGFDLSRAALLTRFAVVVLFTTGLRVSELVSALDSDTDPTDGSIHVRGKGNRERRVYVAGAQALQVLRKYLAMRRCIAPKTDRLLVNLNGRPTTESDVRRWLRTLAVDAGIERRVTPHMLRHTAATQLINAGVDIRFVQQLLGHANISTTQIYTYVSNESLRDHLTRANTFAEAS